MTEPVGTVPIGSLPSEWFVIFRRECETHWVHRFCPGEHKHVQALGWIPALQAWLWFNPTWAGLELKVIPDGEDAHRAFGPLLDTATVVRVPAQHVDRPAGRWLGAWCVPLVANAIGVRAGAVSPDGFLATLLAIPGTSVVSADDAGPTERGPAGPAAASPG